MAEAAKKKAMAKLFKTKKKKTSSRKKADAEADTVVDETPWETVANETTTETAVQPKKGIQVGEFDASAEPEGPHIAQVIDAEEATAALTQARINAKKRTLLGDAASATAEPVPQSFQERALLRRKQEEAARLKDPSLFPSLGGKKMEPKKKTGDIWQLDSVHISEAELEAARPPKLEGEGDEGLGLKVVLQPGTRIVDDGEQLDKILKDIAGEYSMMMSVDTLCSQLADVTPTEELGGLGLRAQILRVFLHDALAESWEAKEMKAVGPGMIALLKRGIVDRAGVREAFEGSLMGWYDDVIIDTPLLPSIIRDMIEPLVLQRVLLASELPDAIVDACVPKVARLAKEEIAKKQQEESGEPAPAAAAAPAAGIPGGPGLSTYREQQAAGASAPSGPARPKASVGDVFGFLRQAVSERETPAAGATAPAPAPAASGSSFSARFNSKPSTDAAVGTVAAATDAGKKKKGKKGKKGGDYQLQGDVQSEAAPVSAAVSAVASLVPPVVPKVEADPNAAEVLQDLYASAGKKKKKAKKAKSASE